MKALGLWVARTEACRSSNRLMIGRLEPDISANYRQLQGVSPEAVAISRLNATCMRGSGYVKTPAT